MTSLKLKLARLPAPGSPAFGASWGAGGAGSAAPRRAEDCAERVRPSLDELRERIARIVARGPGAPARSDPSAGELPFVLERTARGPLYARRLRCQAGSRVGRVPIFAAQTADPAMLALLALDPSLAACPPRRALYLDTETTGLAGGTGTVAFLVGLSWFDETAGAFMLEQFLLRRLGEEAPILEAVRERLAEASMVVTYNGKSFDLPLLRTRFVMNRLEPLPALPHLDLVHVARRIHGRRLKVRTLIAIENDVLGRARLGDVSGGEIVAHYAHFLRTGDEEALLGVVEHNAADVLAMVALAGLYGEPLGSLVGEDLAGVARTLRQAGALDLAAELAEEAVARGGGGDARRARGEIAKARGDKALALADYEALAAEVDDATVRLELAKLYEHHVRAPRRALEVVELGTGESSEAWGRRLARLRRKVGG